MRARILMFGALVGCANAKPGTADPDAGPAPDASCGDHCDHDNDGVFDGSDQCADTPMGEVVNHAGCSDSQLTSALVPFPPFGLTWTPAGDLGRAGGMTWTYVGIQRSDLFHIDWIICDDPATPCGVSLDGAVDATETWQRDATNSDLPNGKLVFTNTTHIALADLTMPVLTGRLTLTIVDATSAPIPFAGVAALHVPARDGQYGAEVGGTAFTITAIIEVQAAATTTWTPYLDYYDAAPTPTTGGSTAVSFGGSFYAK